MKFVFAGPSIFHGKKQFPEKDMDAQTRLLTLLWWGWLTSSVKVRSAVVSGDSVDTGLRWFEYSSKLSQEHKGPICYLDLSLGTEPSNFLGPKILQMWDPYGTLEVGMDGRSAPAVLRDSQLATPTSFSWFSWGHGRLRYIEMRT